MQQLSFLIIIVIFFVFMLLPQVLQRRKHEKELESISPGDWIVTVGGIIGQVVHMGQSRARIRIRNGEMDLVRQAIRGKIQVGSVLDAEKEPGEEGGEEEASQD